MMHGTIGVKSEPGQGSTFYFDLALEAGKQKTDGNQVPNYSLSGVRVLIVDDSRISQQILSQYLNAWGMRTDISVSAEEALEKLENASHNNDPYILAILDYKLNGKNSGKELAKWVKASSTLKDTLLFMVTALAQVVTSGCLTENGFAGFLIKPFYPDHLKAALQLALDAKANNKTLPLISRYKIAEILQSGNNGEAAHYDLFPGTKVLVVDDMKVNLMLITKILARHDGIVSSAMCGLIKCKEPKALPLRNSSVLSNLYAQNKVIWVNKSTLRWLWKIYSKQFAILSIFIMEDIGNPAITFKMINIRILQVVGLLICFSSIAQAAPLPGPADIDRVRPELRNKLLLRNNDQVIVIKEEPTTITKPPAGAENTFFILKNVKVEGSTVFSNNELEEIYGKYLNTKISLNKVWLIADQITKHYRDAGYFLSRAYVPAQQIDSGNITIKVIEGYVSSVKTDTKTTSQVKDIVDNIKQQKPLKIKYLEHELLLLNDLPGAAYKATLQPLDNANDGGVELVLAQTSKPMSGSINFNNFGSRFLGPYQAEATLQGSILPSQQTTISGLTSIPTDEIKSISGNQKIALTPTTYFHLDASYSKAAPGYRLEVRDIDSRSVGLGFSLTQQLIRQRQENLQMSLGIDSRNTNIDILGSPLTRDKVRAARFSVNYDRADNWWGYNYLGVTFSQGINGLGSSNENDLYLSRLDVKPDFFKSEISYTRLQSISDEWNSTFSFAAQKSTNSLYSSEEFGYGGQSFGRGYDVSEISGDSGIAGSIEIGYQGLPEYGKFGFTPYTFYDIGKIWNNNIDQIDEISASSAGIGIKFGYDSASIAKLEMAVPLTKPQDTPLYGASPSGPRYLFQMGYQF